MHKNAYFYSKIAKMAQRWGLRPQTPLPPAAGGIAPRLRRLGLCPQANDKTSSLRNPNQNGKIS